MRCLKVESTGIRGSSCDELFHAVDYTDKNRLIKRLHHCSLGVVKKPSGNAGLIWLKLTGVDIDDVLKKDPEEYIPRPGRVGERRKRSHLYIVSLAKLDQL